MSLYNQHSQPQAAAAAQGFFSLERAAREVPLPGDALRVVDLACHEGGNSLEPMRRVLAELRCRTPGLPVEVTHTDLPGNDFRPVLEMTRSYLGPGVFASVRAGSFYEPLFPPGTVDLMWCSSATHWLSRVPGPRTVEAWPLWQEQARADWQRWVDCRAEELRPGGQVVMVGFGLGPTGTTGAEWISSMVQETLAEVVPKRRRSALVMPVYYRTLWEWLVPLGRGLALAEVQEPEMPEPLWEDLQASGDVEAYADQVADFIRAALHQPQLSLGRTGARLRERLRARVLAEPDKARCRWWLVVLRLVKR
ncbi:MAG: hypothetical protein AB1758_11200 [Candidatus Eremiobacterota bacterium]